jgi:hypothetical protein
MLSCCINDDAMCCLPMLIDIKDECVRGERLLHMDVCRSDVTALIPFTVFLILLSSYHYYDYRDNYNDTVYKNTRLNNHLSSPS